MLPLWSLHLLLTAISIPLPVCCHVSVVKASSEGVVPQLRGKEGGQAGGRVGERSRGGRREGCECVGCDSTGCD